MPAGLGSEAYELITRLYPICRSITGDGVRETLAVLSEHVDLETHEVPTGTEVFDWTVPREWNIRDAYIKDRAGRRVVDFQQSNLHVVGYSAPVRRQVPLGELREHLHSLPDHPEWIPYRTSYYKEDWGFCVTERQLQSLSEDEYEVCIDSSLQDGHLTYGELFLPGETTDEVLLYSHVCHPSLCNDNLSSVALATLLARHMTGYAHRYSYRFLFSPGTIGAITWLALNEKTTTRIQHGLVLACTGVAGRSTYKRTRRGDAEIDRAVSHVLARSGDHRIVDFSPFGYDERQFCSPGFNLSVGCLMRTPHGEFSEYHTSADDLDFVKPAALEDSFGKLLMIIEALEGNGRFINRNPMCEPQLGRRGLYGTLGGGGGDRSAELAMLCVLNLSDGDHDLLDIARRSGIGFRAVRRAADALLDHQLLAEAQPGSPGR